MGNLCATNQQRKNQPQKNNLNNIIVNNNNKKKKTTEKGYSNIKTDQNNSPPSKSTNINKKNIDEKKTLKEKEEKKENKEPIKVMQFGESQNSQIKSKKPKMNETKKEINKIDDQEPIKDSDIILNLKKGEISKYRIKKNPKTSFLNSVYDLILKITLKKVAKEGEYSVKITDTENTVVYGETEKKNLNQNQKVTFNENIIIKYDFTKIQPLTFRVKRDSSPFNPIQKNLGDIVGRPRQIYFEDTDFFNFEAEVIMHSSINKQIQFIIGLIGNLKNVKLNYTIKNLGNRYEKTNDKLVYKSKILEHDSEVIFPQVDLDLNQLSDDDNLEDNLILISFYDGENEIGKEEITINQLFAKDIEIKLNDNIKAKIISQRKNFFTLLQYLYNDYHLVTNFCIDFSKNNNVHNEQKFFENLVQKFMDVLVPYNGDSFFHFNAFGFQLEKNKEIYINKMGPLSIKRPSLDIEEFKSKYENFLKKIKMLDNKIDLALIIKNINDNIKENFDIQDKEYNLFLLFACNDIIDENEFIEQLIITSTLNLSIVIISIGNKRLSKLENILNNIDYIKNKEGTIPKREFIKYIKMDSVIDTTIKNALVNVPDEMIDYFCINNVIPN